MMRREIWSATMLGMVLGGTALVVDTQPASSTPDPLSATSGAVSSAPSVGPTETVSEQAQDVAFTNDGLGLWARVVVGWGGRVTAVWYRPDADVGFRAGRLFASVRRVGGVWSDPVAVSPTFSWPSGDRMDVAAGQGRAVSVVWTAPFEGAMRVFEAHRDGSAWSTPLMLGKGREPRVVMDGLGNTTVLWSHRAPHVVTRTPDGVWSSPHVFTGGTDYPHALAANRAGDEALLWTQGALRMEAAFRVRTRHTWPRAVRVPTNAVDYVGAGLAVDPEGRVLAAWARGGGGGHVWWTSRSLTGRWSPAQKIVGDVGKIGEYGWLDLSVNRHGRGLVRWIADTGGTYVARYRPGHGFGAPVRLSRDRWPYLVAEGSPLLTADGTAVVAGAMGLNRLAYRWQAPGQPWSAVQGLGSSQAVNAVGTRGARMAILFQEQGLRARVIDVR